MIATALLLATIGPLTSWRAPGYDGRGATCETRRTGRVEVEVCERASRLVSVACHDAESGKPTGCPAWALDAIRAQEVRR